MLNIGGDTGDAYYRYKMPKLVAKVEGRGNGIKTNVVNNVDIAKALERPPEYIIKYFGCELGAQTKYEIGTGTSIVNGAHDSSKLAELLEAFIKKYVQCYSCGNPETVVKVKKELISLKCKACGAVSDVDPRHKLNTFILKNPPDNKLSKEEKRLKKEEEERLKGATADVKEKKEKKEKKDKKDKKDKKKKQDDADQAEDDGNAEPEAEAQEENGNADEDDDDEDGVVWLTDISEAAIKKRAAEQLTAATAAMVTQGNIEAEQEEAKRKAEKAARKEAEAAAKRAEELAKRAQKVSLNDVPPEKLDVDAAIELLELCLMGMEPSVAAKALKKLTVEGGPVAKARALFAAAFRSNSETMAAGMKAKKPVFTPKDAAAQLAQLIAMEHFVGVERPERVKEVPHVLKLLYDEDMADEEVIIAWYEKTEAGKILQVPRDAAKLVRQYAAPFVEWLQNADDTDEDEDEDE